MHSKRWQTVVDIAGIESDKAGQDLQESRQQHTEQQRQLEQLLQFQQEYKERLAAVAETGMDARQMQNYRQFLRQLGKAVEQQLKVVAGTDQKLDEQQKLWLSHYQRKSALDNLLATSLRREQYEQEQREQKETDDRNSGNVFADWV